LLQKSEHTYESDLTAKRISKWVLQTKDQLERGMEELYINAMKDGVVYVEIPVRPMTHTREGLKIEEVVTICIAAIDMLNEKYKDQIFGNLSLYVSTEVDNPLSFYDVAKLAVKYKSKVCAFGVYGNEEINQESMNFFKETFYYLKEHNINVSIFAGSNTVQSIVTAISEGGARRISGAFKLHDFPRYMSYCANHSIPIELSLTNQLKRSTQELERYINPIRLFIDNSVPVAICSFREKFHPKSRNEILEEIVKVCNLSASEIIKLLGNGYLYSFAPHKQRIKMYKHFKERSLKLMKDHGVDVNFYGRYYRN